MSGTPPERTIAVEEMLALDADLISVRVANPLPPGSRVRLDLTKVGARHSPLPGGKVVGLERTEAGDYRLQVRLHSVSRREHAALEKLVTGSDHI